jgi:hypothetical protein
MALSPGIAEDIGLAVGGRGVRRIRRRYAKRITKGRGRQGDVRLGWECDGPCRRWR